MKSMIPIFVIFAALAGTAANADEFDNMVKAAEVELRQLLCDLKRVSEDPSAAVKEQIKASERMRHGGNQIEKKYGENVSRAAAFSIASEGENLVCPGENLSAELMENLTRVFCDYHTELNQLREMNMYNHRSDAEAYRQKVAGQFVPFKLESLAKTFGQDRVEEALSDLKHSGTDLANVGSLDCE